MPSLDLSLCAVILHDTLITPVLEVGILPEHLFDDGRKVFEYIKDFYAKFGKLPDVKTVEQDTKVVIPPRTEMPEPLEYYVERVRQRALDRIAKENVKKQIESMEKLDTPGVVTAAQQMLADISKQNLAGEKIDDWTQGTEDRWKEYEAAKGFPNGLTGLPLPWPGINDLTQGVNKGDFWILVGRPGTGKSWLAIKVGMDIWLAERRVLFISMEMLKGRIKRRMDACYAKVAFRDLKKGTLGMHIEEQYKQSLDSLKGKAPFHLVTRKRVKSVADVAILIEQLKPDIVIIDGIYKLRPSRAVKYKAIFETIAEIMDEVQELAQEKEVAILGTTQFNRQAARKKGPGDARMENLAFGDAIGMNADVIIGIMTTFTMKQNNEMVLKLLKNREDDVGAFTVKFNLASMEFDELGKFEEVPGSSAGSDESDGGTEPTGDASVDFEP